MSKEKWIEEILHTAKRIQPVEGNPFLATRVEAALEKPAAARLPLKWTYLLGAAMAVLIALNIMIWSKPSPVKQAGLQSIMQEYGWSSQRFYAADF